VPKRIAVFATLCLYGVILENAVGCDNFLVSPAMDAVVANALVAFLLPLYTKSFKKSHYCLTDKLPSPPQQNRFVFRLPELVSAPKKGN
jgi:hypothetical protein